MGKPTWQVTCSKCRTTREEKVGNVIFSVLHFLNVFVMRCPHCQCLSFHVLGSASQPRRGIEGLGGPDK